MLAVWDIFLEERLICMEIEKQCKKLYRGNLWVNFFTNIRFLTGSFTQLEQRIPRKGRILDLGCGYGILANFLALSSTTREIIGVDTDAKKIKNAEKGILNVSFRVADATKMKVKDFDAIILHDVLHHLDSYDDQEQLINDCKDMLKKDGVLLIVEVDNKPFWKLILGRITDFIMYSGSPVYYRYKNEMIKLLEKYFLKSNIAVDYLRNNPFPQVVYICKKN